MPGQPHYLRFKGRPLCDHLGRIARLCDDAGVAPQCGYPNGHQARTAARRLNAVRPGSTSVVEGECPRALGTLMPRPDLILTASAFAAQLDAACPPRSRKNSGGPRDVEQG